MWYVLSVWAMKWPKVQSKLKLQKRWRTPGRVGWGGMRLTFQGLRLRLRV